MRRFGAILVAASALALSVSSLGADAPTKPREIKLPYNATVQAKQGIAFSGILQVPAPVMLNVAPGSTMQLGPGTTIAINGPMNLGGNFVLNGTITIPKDAVIKESNTVIPQSAPSNPNAHDINGNL
jgi:hypothetical protein